jgi:hypothetical protein
MRKQNSRFYGLLLVFHQCDCADKGHAFRSDHGRRDAPRGAFGLTAQ